MPPSSDAFQWQSHMGSLIYGDQLLDDVDGANNGWRCGSVIDADTAAMIYRRNLHSGVENNLNTQFPVTARYLGVAGFRLLVRALVRVHPPKSPLFNLYAAQLPVFILEFDQFNDQLRRAASALSSIDFFSSHVAVVDQRLDMERRYFELYRSVLVSAADASNEDQAQSGLYQLANLHPESIAQCSSETGHVLSCIRDNELVVEFQNARN